MFEPEVKMKAIRAEVAQLAHNINSLTYIIEELTGEKVYAALDISSDHVFGLCDSIEEMSKRINYLWDIHQHEQDALLSASRERKVRNLERINKNALKKSRVSESAC